MAPSALFGTTIGLLLNELERERVAVCLPVVRCNRGDDAEYDHDDADGENKKNSNTGNGENHPQEIADCHRDLKVQSGAGVCAHEWPTVFEY